MIQGREMCVRLLCFLVLSVQCVPSEYTKNREKFAIGALFYEDEAEDLRNAFEIGAEILNFTTNVKVIDRRGDIPQVMEKVCELAREKVIGIIDGTGGATSEHVQALADLLELPQVMVQHNDLYTKNWSHINLHPSASAYNTVLQELIVKKEWHNFTLLYVKGHSIHRVSDLLRMGNAIEKYTVSVRELSGDDYRDVLTDAKEHNYYNFVVDCQSRDLEQFLAHAQQVGLMADEHSYIFVSPDLFTLNLDPYRFGGVNMTGFRLIDFKKNGEALWTFTEEFNNKTGKQLNPEDIKTKVFLVYDAVTVFYEGVRKIGALEPMELECENYEAWPHGSSLLNLIKTNKVEGITRTLAFDGLGERTDVLFDVLELTPSGNQSIGQFNNNNLTIDRPFIPVNDFEDDSKMRNKTFKVLIQIAPPYGYEKDSTDELESNDRFEGFTIDLIQKLSEKLGFNYEFHVQQTGKKQENGEWTGMIRSLMDESADFAICDLTITSERQSVIDFSTPFMSLGISIIYKEPSKQPPEMFSFMAVFSTEVWLYMMFVQMGIGVIMIFVGRISHKEWQNPVPCIEQPEELSNQFSFANSLWLIIGSVMQQGSEIAPIALAPRLITSVWWFFTMVMVALYVSTLVAFLTVENDVRPFHSAKELSQMTNSRITFGAKKDGATLQFFENNTVSEYRTLYEVMKRTPGVLVESNDAGILKAENEDYAFFSESTSIEYYRQRHCDLLQIGGLLDSKSYGIGMKKNSPYKRYIDRALLDLKDHGEIQKLKDLWWKEKRGGGKCKKKGNEEPKQLGMKNMIGAFVVLGAGCLIGFVITVLDMLWAVFKRSVKYKTTFKYELVEELKFAIKFSGDIKPVKRPPSSDGSSEALAAAAEPEARDELGSLRSAPTVRSGHSTSTSKSTHSHRSRHSSRSLNVAFARRRNYQ